MIISLNERIRETLRSTGGMAVTEESQITQSKTCPNTSLPKLNLTLTVPEHNQLFHRQKPATNLLSDARRPLWLSFRFPKQSAYPDIPGLSGLQFL